MEVVELLAMLAQGVWLSRNKICFENKVNEQELTITKVFSLIHSNQKQILINEQLGEKEADNKIGVQIGVHLRKVVIN